MEQENFHIEDQLGIALIERITKKIKKCFHIFTINYYHDTIIC